MPTPRVVVVHRHTEYDELIARHGTRGQAEFFLTTRGRDLGAVENRHGRTREALTVVSSGIPGEWARAEVERGDLSRFVFRPEDIIVVVGQDGLVANLAKYVDDQPVIGIDPLSDGTAGVLVPHRPHALRGLLKGVVAGTAQTLERTMVRATSDDGQSLTALNEIYVGQPTHQSSRYTLHVAESVERQSSSGIIIGSGTGATGWCASLQQAQAPELSLPSPADATLAWFVREAWPSASTGTSMTHGIITGSRLRLVIESDTLVAFGDGMEADRLTLAWGQGLTVDVAEGTLKTVC
ncbi:NAD(+)/NADH kinase [Tessaracoccus antarcticus]|uniref:Inorganic polyphosphate kinase n=1 Tax=Tessaracoccus antarcticus TaxID=2479848 RepID=A0A3M0G2G0_9ACTN|nr:NAD(+)/NADH kinase [Tessaracoccus antarcticus]RMB58955.1 hypothetical protein EAX62_12695 [Tessaracoccus antarcticus]